MSGQKTALMNIDEVSFGYRRGVTVVRDVSCQVMPGQVQALLGPNASGKSTLLLLMLGHLRPASGQILLCGEPIKRLDSVRRAAWMAYVPQRGQVVFTFSAEQVVSVGRYAMRRDPDAIEQVLSVCNLQDLRHAPYAELSAGQQQRVMLARALAQGHGQGRVALLDEPTSAMDLAHVHRTMRTLRDLARQGMGVVVVLQDINLAARYADCVWLMDRGRLVAGGPWQEVLRPEVLEPVYDVRLRPVAGADPPDTQTGQARPVFDVQLPDEPICQYNESAID